MSANNEFPESDSHYECYASYLAEDVDDWFKRMLDDYPVLPDEFDYRDEFWRLSEWFDKWFDQFIEEK